MNPMENLTDPELFKEVVAPLVRKYGLQRGMKIMRAMAPVFNAIMEIHKEPTEISEAAIPELYRILDMLKKTSGVPECPL